MFSLSRSLIATSFGFLLKAECGDSIPVQSEVVMWVPDHGGYPATETQGTAAASLTSSASSSTGQPGRFSSLKHALRTSEVNIFLINMVRGERLNLVPLIPGSLASRLKDTAARFVCAQTALPAQRLRVEVALSFVVGTMSVHLHGAVLQV